MPESGFKGVISNFRNDFIAGLSVALVALPLGLGISLASGVPPLAGIFSAIIGGLISTFIRGSKIAINGPANGLIVVVIGAFTSLPDSIDNKFEVLLAAFVIAGILQIVFGLLKLGKFADSIPSAVIQGMLASIGLIIIIKQIPVAFGVDALYGDNFKEIFNLPVYFTILNPVITFLSVISLLILWWHHNVSNKFFHFVPAPIWVIVAMILLTNLIGFDSKESIQLLGNQIPIGASYLINLPKDLLNNIYHPDFSYIHLPEFWLIVASVCIVATIENLLSAKAVEKIDPYKRRSELNKDLIGMGVSTILSSIVGGLPVITVIVRSSVNVNHGAKSKMSNFYHGLLLVIFILFFSGVIQQVPLAALSTILIFSGFKLTSPSVYKEVYRRGWDQLILVLVTIFSTLQFGLIIGIAIGVFATFTMHLILTNLHPLVYIRYAFKTNARLIKEKGDDFVLKVKGVATFINFLQLKACLNSIPQNKHVIVDFSHARFIDFTVLENFHEVEASYERYGGYFDMVGLGVHITNSNHPNSIHIMSQSKEDKPGKKLHLTRRQDKLNESAKALKLVFTPEINYETSFLRNFVFFETRTLEYVNNQIEGNYEGSSVKWKIMDVTFDEGAFFGKEIFHITPQIIDLPERIPVFTLEKEEFFDRVLQLAGYEEIDFKIFTEFSKKVVIKGPNKFELQSFFTKDLISFFNNSDIYHLESNGKQLLIFKYHRLASSKEIIKMIDFSKSLIHQLLK